MKLLRAKLYEMEVLKRSEEKQAMEDNKADIGWGSQIRSYVLDPRASRTCARAWKRAIRRRCLTAPLIPLSRPR
jgi:protein subunit release factor B